MTENRKGFGSFSALLGLLAVLAWTPSLDAQTDSGWLAWMGCWAPSGGAADNTLLCFRPLSDDVGVEMVSVTDGEIQETQVVWADAQQHETALDGCSGWDRGDFASQVGRVYLTTEHECEGGIIRRTSGMFAMLSTQEWVDVRVVEVEGEKVPWVMRYRLATQATAEAAGMGDIAADRATAVQASRVAAMSKVGVDHVIEASEYVDAEGVEAWLVERDLPLDFKSAELVRMADAGVEERVIDMVVAVTYPQEFAVGQVADMDRYWADDDFRQARLDRLWAQGFLYTPFGYGYNRYGYNGFGYNGFGYGGYGGYGYGGYGVGYYRPTVLIVDRARSTGGRAINGSGYSQGSRGGSNGTASRRTGSTSSSQGRASSAGASSRGSSGSAAPARSSTGRTAQPRTAKPRPKPTGGGGGGFH